MPICYGPDYSIDMWDQAVKYILLDKNTKIKIIERLIYHEEKGREAIAIVENKLKMLHAEFSQAKILGERHGAGHTNNPRPTTVHILEWLAEEIDIHKEQYNEGRATRFPGSRAIESVPAIPC